MRFFTFIIILLFVGAGCSSDTKTVFQRGVYFWESASDFSYSEENIVKNAKITKIYLKLFELEYDQELGAIPISKSSTYWPSDFDNLDLIPCVYIQNDVFLKTNASEINELADNVHYLIQKMVDEKTGDNSKIREIQIDCDWTPSSKINYFKFLEAFKSKTSTKLSCTLRLYPYKYNDKMGIPPVDRVTLMCYNLLTPKNNESKNSIFEYREFEKYTDRKIDYPLPIDIALPKYSWNICYENKTFKGVVYGPQEGLKPHLKQLNGLWSILQKDTVIDNLYLRRGYRIKHETVTSTELEKLIDRLKNCIQFKDTVTVSFYQLDDAEFNNLPYEKLDSLYNHFN